MLRRATSLLLFTACEPFFLILLSSLKNMQVTTTNELAGTVWFTWSCQLRNLTSIEKRPEGQHAECPLDMTSGHFVASQSTTVPGKPGWASPSGTSAPSPACVFAVDLGFLWLQECLGRPSLTDLVLEPLYWSLWRVSTGSATPRSCSRSQCAICRQDRLRRASWWVHRPTVLVLQTDLNIPRLVNCFAHVGKWLQGAASLVN